jgi:pimeloyl-ACP methyl ester carboxylesterase
MADRLISENEWYFSDRGHGPNLVLLHGLGASSFSWRHNLGPLSRHFRVLAPDLPPHGRSPAPLDGDYTVAGQLRGILDFLDRRGIEQAALAGNSLGGGLALLLARDYPERFPALVLLAPAAALTRVPLIFYPLRLPRLGRLAAACLAPWIIPPALRLIYHRRDLVTPEVISGYAAPFREFPRRLALGRLCQQLNPLPLYQVESLLPQIQQPVSLIWGEQDRILPLRQAHWLKDRLPRAQLHLLPQVGHAPQEEAPAAVNKIIIAFLGRSINN